MSVKKSCSFMVLLFVVVLTFSSFSTVFSAASPFALGAPDNIVSNESELRNVINMAT